MEFNIMINRNLWRVTFFWRTGEGQWRTHHSSFVSDNFFSAVHISIRL